MRAVDTSVWIETFAATPLGLRLARELPERADCVVPTIVQFELAKWLTREVSEEAADQAIAYTLKCEVVALDTAIALDAAMLCRERKLATADAIVYATARARNADLLTCDAHFEGLPGATYFAKER
jgi:predicted nucleic acid-binding protein